MKLLVLITLLAASLQSSAPTDSISLNYCYDQAYEHYPTAQNIDLQKKITELNVRIAHTGYFPDVSVNGQASYRSEVTEFSLPGGSGPPPISKDQYEASVDVTQTIFNGGAVGIRKRLEQARGRKDIQSTKVEMHQIRSQIDQVYFGILLSRQQGKTIRLLMESLREQLSTVRSQVENGVLLPSQQHILKAELIKARQDSIQNRLNLAAGYEVLSELIGQKVTPDTPLALPDVRPNYQSLQPRRAEYNLFESSRKILQQQKALAETQKLPALSAFGTAAYGRPGLNFLNNDFHDYYIVGLKLRWNFWNFLNADREQQALEIQQQKVTQNQRAFTRQLRASLDRISARISSIQKQMKQDRKIIKLRQKIVEQSASQLKNGVITATEYVTELNRANQAQLSLYINKVRLSEARVEYMTTLGIPYTTKRNE